MSGLCLDTNIASRIATNDNLLETLRDQTDLLIPAPAMVEIVRGFEQSNPSGAEALYDDLIDQFSQFAIRIAPFDEMAARVAGHLLGRRPTAPPDASSNKRSKTDRQRAWVFDILIFAVAASNGASVLTRDLRHFRYLAGVLDALTPPFIAPPEILSPSNVRS